MKKKKISFILNSISEKNKIKNYKKENTVYIFNFSNNLKNYTSNILDFYISTNNYKKYNILKDNLCKKWFVKYKKKNLNTQKKNLIGNILFGRSHSDFTDKLRILLSLNTISKKYYKVYYSSSLPVEFIKLTKYFKNLKEFKCKSKIPSFLQSTTKRSTFHYFPSVHKLSSIARNIQNFSYDVEKKNKILVFPDPYFQKLFNKRKDTIYLNSINFKKGFYYKNNVKKNFYFKKSDLNKNEIKKCILKIISKTNKLQIIIADILSETILVNYYDGIKYFNWCYDHNIELLKKYNPSKIVMSNTISFHYLIINYLSKKQGIKTTISFDGIETVFNPLNILIDRNRYIYDQLICYGTADYKLNLRHRIKKDQLLLGQIPILNKFKRFKERKIKKYDFIIMAYQPRTNNLESRWDKKIYNAFQIIMLLNKLNYKKIGIKLKQDTQDTSKEFNYIQNLIAENNLSCEVIEGNFGELLPNIKNIVGGISTAIWEASSIGIPYYIYEPSNMGLLDIQIKKSILFNQNKCARDLKELENKIRNKAHFKINKSLMFDGTPLDELKL